MWACCCCAQRWTISIVLLCVEGKPRMLWERMRRPGARAPPAKLGVWIILGWWGHHEALGQQVVEGEC